MPILPAEPDYYPEDLWDRLPGRTDLDHDYDSVWWCLHTKPRQEKTVGRELRKLGLTYYLPQILKEDRTPGGRKIRSVIPLFPSYMFLRGDQNQRVEAMRGNRLVNVLEVHDQATLERDLRQIHTVLSSGLPVKTEPTVPVGARVRVLSGPLENVEGTVIRRGNRDHFVALVHFLGQGAQVDLEDWQVEQLTA